MDVLLAPIVEVTPETMEIVPVITEDETGKPKVTHTSFQVQFFLRPEQEINGAVEK